jgi:peptidoglycan-N-acetylglucosamine deacetylase
VSKPTASLSFDLDNLWSYLKTHGDAGWERLPTYLPRLIPYVLEWLERRGKKITFFIVGQDATVEANHEPLRSITQAGHEVGNHSFNHEPWMQNDAEEVILDELERAEAAIEAVTGAWPTGFRGPGFCYSPALLSALRKMDYQFDASLLPSMLGPLARLYYMWGAKMSREQRQDRQDLFGRMSDGFLPLAPFDWKTPAGPIMEIPVSTIPVFRTPFHLSYILWLSNFSKTLAISYLRMGLILCRLRGIEPSYLLHPLDFLSGDDAPELAFFPGMNLPRAHKMEIADRFMDLYEQYFEVVPMGEHARQIRARGTLKVRVPETPRQVNRKASIPTGSRIHAEGKN